MVGDRRIFISHADEDSERCLPLLVASDAWGVDYWFDQHRLQPGQILFQEIEKAIRSRHTFVRICTNAGEESYWVQLETSICIQLQAAEEKAGRPSRLLINLVLDADYEPSPLTMATKYIDAARLSRKEWLNQLRLALRLEIVPASAATLQVRGERNAVKPGLPNDSTIIPVNDTVPIDAAQIGKLDLAVQNRLTGQFDIPDEVEAGSEEQSTLITEPPRSQQAFLVGTSGESAGQFYPLQDKNRIGRDEHCTLRLTDTHVSRVHADITREADGFHLTDMSSGNGTWRRSRVKGACKLEDGDQITIGNSTFVFRYG